MNESARTGVFVALAAASLAVAVIGRPASPTRDEFDDSGERFFTEASPLDARSLEVITYDKTRARVDAFKVGDKQGQWVIPSHEDYPADAAEHLAQAAASVLDLVKGPKVSDRAADHVLFGLVDPLDDAADTGQGIGTRVTIDDAAGEPMADFIIGKTVKDRDGVRYVRIPGRDRVYTTAVDTTALTTRFRDWIEEDLLQLQPFDIREIIVNDYTVDEVNQRLVQGERIALTYDASTSSWTLDGLSEGEAIDAATINTMRTALDDLKIIDVHRKPEGLSGELRAEDALQLDARALASLTSRGYYIAGGTLVSNQGETIVRMKDGVQYVLRFGEVSLSTRDGGELGEEAEATGNARYLFVMTEFDPALIEEPVLPEDADDDAVAAAEVERAASIAAGRSRVRQLNERFADWYYVIGNDVYEKVRLTRDDIVKTKDAESAG